MRKYFKSKKDSNIEEEPETTGYKDIDNLIAHTIQTEQVLKPYEFLFLVPHAEKTKDCLKDFKG